MERTESKGRGRKANKLDGRKGQREYDREWKVGKQIKKAKCSG